MTFNFHRKKKMELYISIFYISIQILDSLLIFLIQLQRNYPMQCSFQLCRNSPIKIRNIEGEARDDGDTEFTFKANITFLAF